VDSVPTVTVATVAYNAERYLEECVDSVRGQSLQEYEHLIVDDASTDGTLALARRLAQSDPRIRVEVNARNLGIAGARNRAVELARGEFVAWLDADDIAVSTRLERQHAVLIGRPEVAIVGGYLEFFDDSGSISLRTYPTDDAELRRMLFRFMPVSQGASMVRLSALRRCGRYRPGPAEDLDMLFRIVEIGQMANIPEVVTRYRQVPTSTTLSNLRLMERRTLAIRLRALSGPIRPSIGDLLFNLGHVVAFYILPRRLKLALVSRMRNQSL
jgi:glycosyltransferase involved in cell wall biosynthesis